MLISATVDFKGLVAEDIKQAMAHQLSCQLSTMDILQQAPTVATQARLLMSPPQPTGRFLAPAI
jgi:hypothetical protein